MAALNAPWLHALQRSCAATLIAVLTACGGGSSDTVDLPPTAAAPAVPASAASAADNPASGASAPASPLAVDWPPFTFDVHPGVPLVLELFASHGDGKETWAVTCSAHIACDIVEGNKLQLLSRAGVDPVQATATLTVTDGGGRKASRRVPFVVWPSALAVTSLTGAADRAGLHLLILADGFPKHELGNFHDAADHLVASLFSYPEVAAHREAWNIHRADFVLLDDTTGAARPTGVDAELGCLNTARRLCFSQYRTEMAASQYLPHYNQVIVIYNTTAYGGSAGGNLAAITRNPTSVSEATHELGHSIAGLADEYVDPDNAGVPYIEGHAPNVTNITDPQRIPWRLWIEPGTPLPTPVLPTSGMEVGLYEGGFYVSKGIYRPHADSFMRSIGRPIGAVNGEAWARAVYAEGGAWQRTAPDASATLARSAQPADGWLFEAQPLLGPSIAQTRWYVDGVERVDQRGAVQLRVAAPGALQVRVDLVDLTGRVRLDQGVVKTLTWTVP